MAQPVIHDLEFISWVTTSGDQEIEVETSVDYLAYHGLTVRIGVMHTALFVAREVLPSGKLKATLYNLEQRSA